MLSMIWKDVRLLLRSRSELALLLLMPLILTAILGFAIGSLGQGGGGGTLDMQAVLVVDDDEAAGLQAFTEAVAARDLPPAVQAELLQAAQAVRPLQMLRAALSGDELEEVFTFAELPLAEAEASLADGNAHALIRVPDGFTRDLLNRMLLDEGPGSTLHVALSESGSFSGSVVRDVAFEFARELNFRTALGQLGHGAVAAPPATGSVRTVAIESAERLSTMAYYTFAMAVMFVLYTAGAVSSRAATEQSSHSFDRIMLADTGPLTYLTGKFVSTSLLGFLQLMFLLGVSNLLLRSLAGRPLEFWLSAAAIIAALAMGVGGLAALLTTLNFRLGNKALSDLFYAIVPLVFAMVGGSFFPVEGTLAQIGGWTPNGAATSALVKLASGLSASTWTPELLRLLAMAGGLLAVALLLFPVRKGART